MVNKFWSVFIFIFPAIAVIMLIRMFYKGGSPNFVSMEELQIAFASFPSIQNTAQDCVVYFADTIVALNKVDNWLDVPIWDVMNFGLACINAITLPIQYVLTVFLWVFETLFLM